MSGNPSISLRNCLVRLIDSVNTCVPLPPPPGGGGSRVGGWVGALGGWGGAVPNGSGFCPTGNGRTHFRPILAGVWLFWKVGGWVWPGESPNETMVRERTLCRVRTSNAGSNVPHPALRHDPFGPAVPSTRDQLPAGAPPASPHHPQWPHSPADPRRRAGPGRRRRPRGPPAHCRPRRADPPAGADRQRGHDPGAAVGGPGGAPVARCIDRSFPPCFFGGGGLRRTPWHRVAGGQPLPPGGKEIFIPSSQHCHSRKQLPVGLHSPAASAQPLKIKIGAILATQASAKKFSA